jgi:hypothetical protein
VYIVGKRYNLFLDNWWQMWWYVAISSLALLMLVRGTGSPDLPPIPAASERHVNSEPLPDMIMPKQT